MFMSAQDLQRKISEHQYVLVQSYFVDTRNNCIRFPALLNSLQNIPYLLLFIALTPPRTLDLPNTKSTALSLAWYLKKQMCVCVCV